MWNRSPNHSDHLRLTREAACVIAQSGDHAQVQKTIRAQSALRLVLERQAKTTGRFGRVMAGAWHHLRRRLTSWATAPSNVTVTISTTFNGATMRYTKDGSNPTENNGVLINDTSGSTTNLAIPPSRSKPLLTGRPTRIR
jgi:hypothetical protein